MGRFLTLLFLSTLLAAGCQRGSKPGAPPPVNDAPVAANDSARTRPGVAVDIDVLANDSDRNGDALVIDLPATNPSATFSTSGGRLRVTPATGFTGTLTFTYRARDPRGAQSAPATVSLVVGVEMRALVMLGSMVGFNSRAVIASTTPGEVRELVNQGACDGTSFASISADGRRVLGQRCGNGATRTDIVLSLARATPLAEHTVVLANASLAQGIASVGSNEVLAAERVVNPDDLSQSGAYDLVGIDIAQRAVTRRFALTGLDRVTQLRRLGGGPRRALLLGTDLTGATALFVADLDATTVQRLSGPGPLPTNAQVSTPSPDGRFVALLMPGTTSVEGYDQQDPGQWRTLWTVPNAGSATFITQLQFVPELPATIVLEVSDFVTQQSSIWVVPLAAPADARTVASYPSSVQIRRLLVRGDVAVYSVEAGAGLFHIRRVRLSTGDALPALSPAAGVALNSLDWFNGDALLLTTFDAGQRSRGALVRVTAPGILEPIAPDFEIAASTMSIDEDETTVGFARTQPGPLVTPYVVDVNLLTEPVPLDAGRQIGEFARHVLVLGPPERP